LHYYGQGDEGMAFHANWYQYTKLLVLHLLYAAVGKLTRTPRERYVSHVCLNKSCTPKTQRRMKYNAVMITGMCKLQEVQNDSVAAVATVWIYENALHLEFYYV
jgi:hypothetical protein